ncbi:MAG: glucose-6-phosphate isomerase [Candidatus Nanohaloarchaeota archaeon QJJ-5]|nr:glucose-6-phosphate isomerase [Candidatus Nanohaloarchaeota archaeon QJJ-5]
MTGQTLKFGTIERDPDVRMLTDMEAVIWDKAWYDQAEDRPLYFMYRDLFLDRHDSVVHEYDVRYDITVMPPGTLGREYVKTKGHYHPEAAQGLSFPEIYEVIQGEATYLMQRKAEDGTIDDVRVVDATAGDKVIIPPNYGHITVNTGDRTLKMANWVSRQFGSIYQDIEERRGGAYYLAANGDLVANNNYDDLPKPRRDEPREVPDLRIESETPMYKMIQRPNTLRFLNHPEKFEWLFDDISR